MSISASSMVDKVVAGKVEEVETCKKTELGDRKEEIAAGEVEELVAGKMEELVTGEVAEQGNGLDERADYEIMVRKRVAAMRKEQVKAMEGGWMRCASCRKRGSLRCAACYMTTYCGLECHEKHWREGHRGRCREIRKEFVEVVLEPED